MVKNNSNPRIFTLNCRGQLLTTEQPLVMGILNITPDSFFAGSRISGTDGLIAVAQKMLDEGVAILDIGGQSTRPKSSLVSAGEELERVLQPVKTLLDHFPNAIISVDTFYASVARAAVEAGASIINDISGGQFDMEMIPTAGALQVPYVCMHMAGTIGNMHHIPAYTDVTQDVLDFFIRKKDECEKAGIRDIIIDPGFGFGKTMDQNYELLQRLEILQITGLPILAGLSRKSMIWKTLNITAGGALNGTTVLNTSALLSGASILRVHDVREAVEAVKLTSLIKKSVPGDRERMI